MRKNQKHQLSSYSSLIKGAQVVANFHSGKVDEIHEARRKGKKVDEQELSYHNGQLAYFQDVISRYLLQRAVCGDPVVVIR